MRMKDWFRQLTMRQRVLYTGLMVLAILPILPSAIVSALLSFLRWLTLRIFMMVCAAQEWFECAVASSLTNFYLTKVSPIALSLTKKF